MRIAFILSNFPTISETFILNQITGLIDRGHEVDIFAEDKGKTLKIHPDVKNYNLLERTYYPKIPSNKFWRVLKGVWLIFVNFHKNPLMILRSLNVFKYKRQALSLRLLYIALLYIGRKPYDIIHCHFGPCGLLGMQMVDIQAIKGRLITTFHGFDMSTYVSRQGNKVYSFLFEKGDLFLPVSQWWKRKLIDLGCDENKILVHHMGVDCRKLSLGMPESGKGEQVRILTIARLVEKKGVEYGIRAVTKLSSRYDNIEYNIVGDGSLRDRLESVVEKLKVSNNVRLLGSKDHSEVCRLLTKSHLLLCPSVTSSNGDQEGIPVALMEGMAHGLPVIATRHSGIPELVEDSISGFLVPERDVDALAERIEYLLEHPELWPEMGRAGRAHVEAHYDIDKLNDRLAQIYQQLLDGKINSGM